MIYDLDENGFIKNTGSLAFVDQGELIDLMYKRFKTEKWYIMFLPWQGFDYVAHKIEITFYKDDRNHGFEISPIFTHNCVLVMCYKQFMSPQNLYELLNNTCKYADPSFKSIPEGKDIIFFQGTRDLESPTQKQMRFNLFMDFTDYCKKQVSGE